MQVGLQRLEWRRTVAAAVLAYDIYKCNINDEMISSNFIRNTSEYNLRRSTLNLLVEPRLYSEYLRNQPIVRLIRLINDYKDIVDSSTNRNEFKCKIFETISSSR